MIRDLVTVLGPAGRRPVQAYLAWAVGYGVAQGLGITHLFYIRAEGRSSGLQG